MKMKVFNFLIIFLSLTVNAQESSISSILNSSTNYYETEKLMNEYFKIHPPATDNNYEGTRDWRHYQRWKNAMRDKVMPDSSYVDKTIVTQNIQASANKVKARSIAGWTSINQTKCTGAYNGMGQCSSIATHPTNDKIAYFGSQAGGLWRTSDGGATYTPLTDNLPNSNAENVVLDQTDPRNIYITLGQYTSLGIYKSTDEGVNWNPTGLVFPLTSAVNIYDVEMSPVNNKYLFAATSYGIYRTINSGDSWQLQTSGDYSSVTFKPGSGTVLYAALRGAPGKIMKSTNTGATWTQVYTTTVNNSELDIQVSAANPSFLAVNTGGQIYTSFDEGVTWAVKGVIPQSGPKFAVSPTDPNIMMGGYFEVYRSTDCGATWAKKSVYYYPNSAGLPGVHADIHAMQYAKSNPSMLYIGTDGGPYSWNETTQAFTEITNGFIVTMFYDIKVSQKTPYILIGGTQDNGGRKMNADGTWISTNGGDAMTQAMDPNNPNIFYTSYASSMYRTANGWVSSVDISPKTNGKIPNGEWELPFCLDPNTPAKIIAAYDTVWTSINNGTSWTKTSKYNFGGALQRIAMTKANSNIIFLSRESNLYKSTDAGLTWTTKSMSSIIGSQRISFILVSPLDDNIMWISVGGYSAGKKVFKSIDGGTTWTNISGTLPNVTNYRLAYEDGTNNRLYLATDCGGLYFRDDTMADWAYYGDGLPNSEIRALEIRYADRKLIVGTFGRGLWMGSLVGQAEAVAPYCDFNAVNTVVRATTSVQFNDLSTNSPTSWAWTFTGGTPATSDQKSPTVTYPTIGTYPVSLTVSNATGSSTTTKVGYITVSTASLTPNIIARFNASATSIAGGTTVNFTDISTGTPNSWEWAFEGGTPATSSLQNPTVTYNNKGSYRVALTAKNANGSNTVVKDDNIVVNSSVTSATKDAKSEIYSIYSKSKSVYADVKSPSAQLSLYDLDGKLIETRNVTAGLYKFTTQVPTGVYVVKIVYDRKAETERVVVE